MSTITIPKKITSRDDLVILPRKEYEELIEIQKVKEFTPTPAQKKALKQAERNFDRKKTFSYNELVKKLGFTD